jgi:polysaccharide export outer membrane protein
MAVKRLFSLPVIVAGSIVLTNCADSRGGSIPYNVGNFGAPDTKTVVPLAPDYKIAPMDTLTVNVYRVTDLSGDYIVDLRGNISMPLVGDVVAAGESPEELSKALEEKLGQKYLQDPDVSVAIKESAARNVTVDGAVAKAGSYPVIGPMTLIQAVALAGGTAENANPHRVAVFRTIGGQRQAAAFDLASIRHGEMDDPPIYPGDIVVVDGSKIKETLKQLFQSSPLLSIFRPVI